MPRRSSLGNQRRRRAPLTLALIERQLVWMAAQPHFMRSKTEGKRHIPANPAQAPEATAGYNVGAVAYAAAPVARSGSDWRRIGWRAPYVSDRHTHSAGPTRKRASHQWLNGTCIPR